MEAIALYPNPADYELFIDLKEFEGNSVEIIIYNQLGQVMDRSSLDEITLEPVRIDLRDYRGGMFFATLQIDNLKLITKKFVVGK